MQEAETLPAASCLSPHVVREPTALSHRGLPGEVIPLSQHAHHAVEEDVLAHREIGLRMALGADAATVGGMVLRQMARMTLVGASVGLLAAFGLGAAARSLLYGLDGFDPLVVASSVGLLAIIAMAAALAPAMRASRIDPMRALRWD